MWRDCDPPALVDAHALQTPVHPRDESAQADLADEGFASVMAAEGVMEMRIRVGKKDEGNTNEFVTEGKGTYLFCRIIVSSGESSN